jgi:hypothetical protein
VDDIVEWLRGLSKRRKDAWGAQDMGCRYDEAADEIERLRWELDASQAALSKNQVTGNR